MRRYHRTLAGLCATSVLAGACRPAPASMSMPVPVPVPFLPSAVAPVLLHRLVPGFAGCAGQAAELGRFRSGRPMQHAGRLSPHPLRIWFSTAESAARAGIMSFMLRVSGFMLTSLRVFVAVLPLMLPVPGSGARLINGIRPCRALSIRRRPDGPRMVPAFLAPRRRQFLLSRVLHRSSVVSLTSSLHDCQSAVLQGAARG